MVMDVTVGQFVNVESDAGVWSGVVHGVSNAAVVACTEPRATSLARGSLVLVPVSLLSRPGDLECTACGYEATSLDDLSGHVTGMHGE